MRMLYPRVRPNHLQAVPAEEVLARCAQQPFGVEEQVATHVARDLDPWPAIEAKEVLHVTEGVERLKPDGSDKYGLAPSAQVRDRQDAENRQQEGQGGAGDDHGGGAF